MSKESLPKTHFSKQLPPIAIVSVTRNRSEPLMQLLSQLGQLDYPQELLDIFLVDSGSTDDTVKKVGQGFPQVNLTLSQENLGIAAGFNMAIKAALNANRKYKYLWLLDSDAQIEKQTLMPLVEAAETCPEIAVAGSAVYEPAEQDKLIAAGLFIDWKNCNVAIHTPEYNSTDGLFDVELIPACSSLTRADLYGKLGLWDERLWLYWGDTEWCTRALRNGYRVCCVGKSKVWHRNWANIKPDFYFPLALHDRIRSALLFNFMYNPKNSIAPIRRMILKSYLKAAFEHFTLRPNFSRAYDEGIRDFLKVDFSRKDFSSWFEKLDLIGIEQACLGLDGKIPKVVHIILNQLEDDFQKEQLKNTIQNYFPEAEWEEVLPQVKLDDADASMRMKQYICFHLPQLLKCILTFYKRKDLIISSAAVPYLYNIAAAKYTVLIDSNLHCCVRKNEILKSFCKFIMTIMRALKTVLVDLPIAKRNPNALKGVKRCVSESA